MAIMLCMLLSVVFLIFKSYKTPLDSKSFLVNVYLYVLVAVLFIGLVGKYAESLKITNVENTWKMMILYFIMAMGGIFMMTYKELHLNHIGFLLMLLALSLIIGVSYKYSSNVSQAAAITAVIVSILTMFVFMSSEEELLRMTSWLPNLTSILLGIIIIELGYMFLFDYSMNFHKFMSITVITLFIFFILSDTSRLIMESKNLECKTHDCINYPLKASSLILDYLNIFVRLLNDKH
jgi:FtsH-binding integral membrane protein